MPRRNRSESDRSGPAVALTAFDAGDRRAASAVASAIRAVEAETGLESWPGQSLFCFDEITRLSILPPRRSVLGVAIAAFGGCLANDGDDRDESTESTPDAGALDDRAETQFVLLAYFPDETALADDVVVPSDAERVADRGLFDVLFERVGAIPAGERGSDTGPVAVGGVPRTATTPRRPVRSSTTCAT